MTMMSSASPDRPAIAIRVPAGFRPPTAPSGGVEPELAIKRAEALLVVARRSSRDMLGRSVERLLAATADLYLAHTAAEVEGLRGVVANLRGTADMLGTPLVGDLGDALFEAIAHGADAPEAYRALVPLLSAALKRMADLTVTDAAVQYEPEIAALVTAVRVKFSRRTGNTA
jgi:hypothetical protein